MVVPKTTQLNIPLSPSINICIRRVRPFPPSEVLSNLVSLQSDTRMQHYRLLLGAGLILFFFCSVEQLSAKSPREVDSRASNIVLIMADDMGYECVGANGSTSYETPVLNGLAKTGMRFTNCFSTPICTPTRVQIMTGKYNFRNYSHFGYLNPKETTFAHLLKKAGYATCIAGKWQLNGLYHDLPGNQDSDRPQAFGFDESCLWQLTQQKKAGERFADALIEQNGKVLGKQIGKYGPDLFCDFVCQFIDKQKSKPFFCYYPMVLVHDPFVPTPDSPEWQSGNRYQKNKRFFADMVAYADKIVGRILKQLEDSGVADNTLVIFIGDNGTHRSITSQTKTGPVRGGKGYTFETGIHVPMFVSWPSKIAAGETCEDLIDFTDVLPTALDAAGVPIEKELWDGRSFLPQVRGETGNPRKHIFCHYDPRWGPMKKTPTRFVRDKQFKLYEDGRMFDVSIDPLEEHALEKDTDSTQPVRATLQHALDAVPPWVKQEQKQ